MDITHLRNELTSLLENYAVRRMALFGSFSRGEERPDSDIDLLVDLPASVSLLGFIELKEHIEAKLKRKVDLVEYSLLKPRIREKVLQEQIVFYDKGSRT